MARILLDYSASDIRLFFRIFFNIASAVITIVGNQCLEVRAKVKLARGNTVPLPHLTSWLSNYSALSAWQQLRALPGGWLYPLMVLAYLLHLGSDYTTALLPTVSVQDRCTFGTGLVMSTNGFGLVPWNGAPYTVVAAAQVTSLLNGGLQGVYKKANRALDFAADASDLLGEWQCTRSPTELDYPADVSINDTVISLQEHDLLYDTPFAAYSLLDTIAHLVIVDTSAGENVDTLFDIRVSVDTTPYGNPDRNMQSYQCTLNDSSGLLGPVQQGIHSLQTLIDWAQRIQGAVYDGTGTPASNNTAGILAQVFNSMTMVAGGGNYLLNTTQANETQGCITRRTHILWELLLLAGLTLGLVVLLILYRLGLAAQLSILARRRMESSGTPDTQEKKKLPPVGIFKWMAQAVIESQQTRVLEIKEQDLRQWSLSSSPSRGGYRIVQKGAVAGQGGSEEAIALKPNARVDTSYVGESVIRY